MAIVDYLSRPLLGAGEVRPRFGTTSDGSHIHGGHMTSVRRARLKPRLWLVVGWVWLWLGSSSAWGSIPGDRTPRPTPISPAADATVYESGLRFAWTAPGGTSRHLLLLSHE